MRTRTDVKVLRWCCGLVAANAAMAVVNAAYGNITVAVFNVAMGALLAYQIMVFPK